MNANEICEAAVAGTIAKADAISQLVAIGYDIEVAREEVFIAQGGDDFVLDDAQSAKNIAASWLK